VRTTEFSGVAGVEVHDVDLNMELASGDITELQSALLRTHLLVFHEQDIDSIAQARFLSHFGQLKKQNGEPMVEYVSTSRPDDIAGPGRLLFHSDACFTTTPPYGSSLYPLKLSSNAPATMFANMETAFMRLPDAVKTRIMPLTAVNVFDETSRAEQYRIRKLDLRPEDQKLFPHATHPAVLHLPLSSSPVLFVSEHQTSHFVELDAEDGEELYQDLLSYIYTEDNIIVYEWQIGDLLVWNNLALQHARPAATDAFTRELRRIQLSSAS